MSRLGNNTKWSGDAVEAAVHVPEKRIQQPVI
jgi:hypothetical protein